MVGQREWLLQIWVGVGSRDGAEGGGAEEDRAEAVECGEGG